MDIGGKIANRVADVAVQAITSHKARMTPAHLQTVALALEQFFDVVSSEIRMTSGDMMGRIADHPDLPPEMRELFRFMARGKGQWQSMLGGTLIGTTISGGIGDLITNMLAPTVHSIISSEPHGILTPDILARMVVSNVDTPFSKAVEAAAGGLGREHFQALVDVNTVFPGVPETLDLLNRGAISDGHARFLLFRNGIRDDHHNIVLALRHVEITPAVAADMVVRGILSTSDGQNVAARSGMRPDDFTRMVLDTGEPPAIQDLLFLYRRGKIDRARLEHGIRQSRTRDEWIDAVESLGVVPMSTSDAVEAVVKGHLSDVDGQRIATENGLDSAHWATLLATAGNPPGVQEMLSWHNRGIMSTPDVIQGIRESRLNNKYIATVLSASEALPPMVTIRQLVAHGQISTDQGMRLLEKHGYAPDIATAIIGSALHEKTTKTRDLSVEQVLALYELRQMDASTALDLLRAMGYDQAEAQQRLDLADLSRVRRYIDAVVARLHSAYVRHLIDENEVTSRMDRLGITPDARTDLLTLWDEERATVSKTLTEAQVIAALKAGLLAEGEALGRLLGQGYGDVDAQILIDLALKRRGTTSGGQPG